MATKQLHQRSFSDIKKTPKTPYLPDSGEGYAAVRVPKQFVQGRVSVESPQKRARSVLFNDTGSEMFKAVNQRKETQRQLLIMENRIKALQKAEDEARRKLETARKLTREKAAFLEQKQQYSAEKKQWKEAIKRQRTTSHLLVGDERQARRDRLQQSKDRAKESRCVKSHVGKGEACEARFATEIFRYADDASGGITEKGEKEAGYHD